MSIAITSEISRSQAADTDLYQRLSNETSARVAKDSELEILINQESSRAQSSENLLTQRLTSEISRSITEDERLSGALLQEIADRQDADAELVDELRAAKLTFEDTSSIDFNSPYVENNIVKADVKLQGGDNIIKLGSGLYATATLEYEPTGNKIRLVTSNGAQEYIQLVGATLLDSIEYDSVNKMLIIKYTDGTGTQREATVGVTDLWNEWIVNNPSEKSAVELTKTIGDPGNADTISAKVLITDDRDGDGKPDAGSSNIIEIKNNGLYVDGSKLSAASETAECVKNEVKVLERAVIGHMIGNECGSGYTYEPNTMATYINNATSFNNADYLLDQAIKNVSIKIDVVSAKTDCADEKTNKIYELLYGTGQELHNCGDGSSYQPYAGACIISAATSFNEADKMLNDQLCEILTMWTSAQTCTSESEWVEDSEGRKMEVNVRLSHGKSNVMTDDDLTINSIGNSELTDTNVLRTVCLPDGVALGQNGIYLSNAWDCGEQQEGEIRTYNYMNNVR